MKKRVNLRKLAIKHFIMLMLSLGILIISLLLFENNEMWQLIFLTVSIAGLIWVGVERAVKARCPECHACIKESLISAGREEFCHRCGSCLSELYDEEEN